MILIEDDLEQINRELEQKHPQDILCWAFKQLRPKIAASSSFQTQGIPLLHMISQVVPELPIIFLDTGYHFPETLLFRDQLVGRWNLKIQVVKSSPSRGINGKVHLRSDLYRSDPDHCCYLNKIEPMQRAMTQLSGWISGVRRDQSPARADIKILEQLSSGLIRIHPLATWTDKEVWSYVHNHNLPEHPLLAQGYLSVGCAPCTRPIFAGEDERAGRWNGHQKTECGLHTLLRDSHGNEAQTKL